MKKRKTYWFVEPLNGLTNEAIARELAKTADVSEALCLDVGDGSSHQAFQLPNYRLVGMLYADKNKFNFKFRIYRRQGGGKLAEWLFGDRRNKFSVA